MAAPARRAGGPPPVPEAGEKADTHRRVGGAELVELTKKLLSPKRLSVTDFYLARYNSLVTGALYGLEPAQAQASGLWLLSFRALELLAGIDPLRAPVSHGLAWIREGIYYRGYVLVMELDPRGAGRRYDRRTWVAFRVGCQDPEGYAAKRRTKQELKRRIDEIVGGAD